MSNFIVDRNTGNGGEAAFMAACVEMGYTPFPVLFKDNYTHFIDVKYARPAEDRIEFFSPDVKAPSSWRPVKDALVGKWHFNVEWKGARSDTGTNMSASNAATSHIVYISQNPDGGTWRRPFYIVDIEDVRSFYLAHKHEENVVMKVVNNKTGEEYPHCRNLYVPAFIHEYGFEYCHYSAAEGKWKIEKYGEWTCRKETKSRNPGVIIRASDNDKWYQFLLVALREKYKDAYAYLMRNDIIGLYHNYSQSEEAAANALFNGNKIALRTHYNPIRHRYSEQYSPET